MIINYKRHPAYFLCIFLPVVALYLFLFTNAFTEVENSTILATSTSNKLDDSLIVGENAKETWRRQPRLDNFGDIYINEMRQRALCQINGSCPVRLIIYDCSGNRSVECGGLGDRFRGLVSLFYTAYCSNRLLLINWTIPADFGQLFHINEQLYQINTGGESLLNLLMAKLNQSQIEQVENNHGLYYFSFRDANLLPTDQPYFRLILNDLILLNTMFTQPAFRGGANEILNHLGLDVISYDLAVSLALKVLLSRPTERLKEAMQLIKSGTGGNNGCQVGTQLRASPMHIYHRYKEWPRVSKEQIETCFLSKIIQVAKESNCDRVYIASDSIKVKQFLESKLKEEGIKSFFLKSRVIALSN